MADTYILTIKENEPESKLATLISQVEQMGGTVVKKFDIIPSVVVSIPHHDVQTLESSFPFADVEKDATVHILQNKNAWMNKFDLHYYFILEYTQYCIYNE